MSQPAVLSNKIQIANYSIRFDMSALNLNIKIRCWLIYTDKFGVYYFQGLSVFEARSIFSHRRTINLALRNLKFKGQL